MDEYLRANSQEWRVSSCALSTTWTKLPLLSKTAHTTSSSILEFGLPEGYKTLSLPTCGVVMVRVPKKSGEAKAIKRDLATYEELMELAPTPGHQTCAATWRARTPSNLFGFTSRVDKGEV